MVVKEETFHLLKELKDPGKFEAISGLLGKELESYLACRTPTETTALFTRNAHLQH